MKKMLIVRGPQGSGKTTLIERLGLSGHRLSADAMRQAHRGHVLNLRGDLVVDQEDAHQIWDLVRMSLDRRIARGEFIVMDATFPTLLSYEDIVACAADAGYRIAIVDLYGTEMETVRERNGRRSGTAAQVPDRSIEKTVAAYQPHDAGDGRIDAIFHGADIPTIQAWAWHQVMSLDSYESIVHVGDMQGVFEAMFAEGSPLPRELSDDTFYVFVGDALDRGIENGAVMKWIIEQVSPRLGRNAVWIAGNHERHLRDFVDGNDIVSREFENRTLPDLCRASPISTNDIRIFLDGMSDYLLYSHAGEIVVVTHAGVPAVPGNFDLVPAAQAMLGVGGFGADVDEAFSAWASTQELTWRSVHGHRNRRMHPTRVNEHSFNLEGQAEFGGHVRMAVKSRDGWTTHDLRNETYLPPKEWRDINREEERKAHSPVMPIPAWIERGEGAGKLSQEAYDAFAAHKHVAIRPQGSAPHIEAIAFTKSAFYGQVWDGTTNKARGLFVDSGTKDIVARGFDKFFNLGERPETDPDAIAGGWAYPVAALEKSNGYLGLCGWDERSRSITFSSKGDMGGDFAQLFERIARARLGDGGVERLTRAVRDLGGCAAFEVISPTEDPHIVEYAEEDIVLLAFIRRSEDYEALDHDKLRKLGAYIGVKVIPIVAKLPNPKAILSYMERVAGDNPPGNVALTEGVVLADAAGNHVKIKTRHYSLWKRARQLVEKLALQRRKGQEIVLNIPSELGDFMAWVIAQDDEITDQPIIELRRRFLETPHEVLVVDREEIARQRQEAERHAREAKETEGFMRGYDAMLSRVRDGTATTASIGKLLERANAAPHLADAMRARPDYGEIESFRNRQEAGA